MRTTASDLKHIQFPNCTRYCQLYALTRNTADCKDVCLNVPNKNLTYASILKVEMKESLLV